MTTCNECQRWQSRIEAAADAGDNGKAQMLQKLYKAHLERDHQAQSIQMGQEGLWPGRSVIVVEVER
jgi:hypothetical protein